MSNWKKYSNQTPDKDGEYLTVRLYDFGYGCSKIYAVLSWANNLRKTCPYDFDNKKYDHEGFWDSDSEWGAYEIDNVEAWTEIEPYEG